MAFIFDPNLGETPEGVARRRQIAAALLGQGGGVAPRSTMDGLGNAFASIANGIAANTWNSRADDTERSGRESADSLFNQIVGGITTGSPITGSAGPVQSAPADPSVSGLDPNNPVYSDFMGTVQQGGVTNPYALAAIASTGHAESRFDPNNANRTWSDPSVSGKPGTAGGVMSWRGDRLNNLYQFAAQRGEKPGNISPQTQAAFFLSEDPSLIQNLQQAKSASEAQALMNNAWRFANYDKPGGEAARRTNFAQGLLPSFQGDQASLPPNAQPTAGQGQQQQPMGGGNLQQLMQAAANPWLNEGQRAIINSMIEQQMQAQDPMRQLQMRKLQQQVDNPGSDENFYGNPVAVQNQDGSIAYGQIGNRGTFKPIQLGEGQSFAPPTRTIDAGTETLMVDQAGNVISRQPKNLSQAEADKVQGKAQGEARVNLPTDIANADQTVQRINELLDSDGLSSIVGPFDQFRPSWTMDADGRDALARYKQLQGAAFLQAYGILRGGGQITEVEGAKAQDAMARLDRAQDEETFKIALRDFRDAVQTGLQKMREKAGAAALPSGAPPASSPPAGQPTTDYRSKYGLE